MPFGVELPENFGNNNAQNDAPAPSGAPDGASPAAAPSTVSAEPRSTQTPTAQELLDLDKHERFRFKGKDWTREEFEKSHLRHQDYTQKTQELAERRKYVDNFAADISTVAQHPHRMADFERLYPKEFVAHAKTLLARMQSGQQPQDAPQTPTPSIKLEDLKLEEHPQFKQLMGEVGEWKEAQRETQIKSINAWLENQHSLLTKKYPHAVTELVESRAHAYATKNGGDKITAEYLEKAYKANHDEMKARTDAMYKTKINQQLKAGKEARDVGPGGDIPGGEPKNPRTLKEAKEAMLSHYGAK